MHFDLSHCSFLFGSYSFLVCLNAVFIYRVRLNFRLFALRQGRNPEERAFFYCLAQLSHRLCTSRRRELMKRAARSVNTEDTEREENVDPFKLLLLSFVMRAILILVSNLLRYLFPFFLLLDSSPYLFAIPTYCFFLRFFVSFNFPFCVDALLSPFCSA